MSRTFSQSDIGISLTCSILLYNDLEKAGLTRLELAASCVTGRRSNQLNYNPGTIPNTISSIQFRRIFY